MIKIKKVKLNSADKNILKDKRETGETIGTLIEIIDFINS